MWSGRKSCGALHPTGLHLQTKFRNKIKPQFPSETVLVVSIYIFFYLQSNK